MPELEGGFNMVGFSQGAQFLRVSLQPIGAPAGCACRGRGGWEGGGWG